MRDELRLVLTDKGIVDPDRDNRHAFEGCLVDKDSLTAQRLGEVKATSRTKAVADIAARLAAILFP
jgi:hypothetical protein